MTYTSPIIDQIDREFIDVDFREVANNDPSLLGWYEPTQQEVFEYREHFLSYRDTVYPRSEWSDRIKQMDEENAWPWRFVMYRYRQQEGSCVYNSLAQCQNILWNRQFGLDQQIPMSPMSGYRHNASGPNSGSNVSGSVKWSSKHGLLPSSDYAPNLERVRKGDFKVTHHETGNWSERFPSGWEQDAAKFRIQEWFWCDSVEKWVSAILNGYVASGGRNGHCICHCGLAMDGRSITSVYVNSWGRWGATLDTINGPLQSFGVDSEGRIRTMVSRGGFVARTVRVPDFMLSS